MGKSNNKLIYHHALFLFSMAINGFTMEIIKEKIEPARALFSRPLLSLWAFDTQHNETAQPELSFKGFNLGPRTTGFFFCGRCCLTKQKKLKVYKTDMIHKLSNTEHRAHDPQIYSNRRAHDPQI